MKSVIKWGAVSLIVILLAVNLGIATGNYLGIYLNTSHSVDGLLFKSVNDKPKRNDYVLACPPPNQVTQTAKERHYITYGPCPGDYEYLIKLLAAVPGDTVTITASGMYVNGQKLAGSEQRKTDGNGEPMNLYELHDHVLSEDEYLLFGDNSAKSFDSRYFGLVTKSGLIKKIERI